MMKKKGCFDGCDCDVHDAEAMDVGVAETMDIRDAETR